MTWDVVVVGAGIVGAACAERLACAGLRVAVIDAGTCAGGVTSAGMGHLVAVDGSPAQLTLTRYGRALWRERSDELPPTVEWDPCGTLWVAEDQAQLALAHVMCARLSAASVAAEVLDATELRAAEPRLAPDLAGGLHVPDDAVVYPPAAAQWLLERAQSRGAHLRANTHATRLTGGGVTLSGGERLSCGRVVNAAGLHALTLLAPGSLPEGVQLEPRKGHLLVTERAPGFLRHQLVELGYVAAAHSPDANESISFNLQPRLTGQLLIGSSRQHGERTKHVEPAIVHRILERALRFVPDLAAVTILRGWTGLRPATPDGLPWIGPVPGHEDVLLAAGHEGLGITTALATAALIAAEVLGEEPAIDPRPYAPSRGLEPAHA
jgi:glycine/D-amino acid oxidase-like deaminating enzyme